MSNILLYNYFDNVPTRPLPLQTTEGFPFDWLQGIGYVDRAVGLRLAELVAQGNKVTLDLPWKPDNDTRLPRVMQNTMSGVSLLPEVPRYFSMSVYGGISQLTVPAGFHVQLQLMGTYLRG